MVTRALSTDEEIDMGSSCAYDPEPPMNRQMINRNVVILRFMLFVSLHLVCKNLRIFRLDHPIQKIVVRLLLTLPE